MTTPTTKVARQAQVIRLLDEQSVRSQAEMVDKLAEQGLYVTQATVSRDLEELGAVRLRGDDGHLVYALPTDLPSTAETTSARLARLLEELVVGVEASANIVVVRTPPGAAQFLASAMDAGGPGDVIGTVAGDDTVLMVTRDPDGARAVSQSILAAIGHRD